MMKKVLFILVIFFLLPIELSAKTKKTHYCFDPKNAHKYYYETSDRDCGPNSRTLTRDEYYDPYYVFELKEGDSFCVSSEFKGSVEDLKKWENAYHKYLVLEDSEWQISNGCFFDDDYQITKDLFCEGSDTKYFVKYKEICKQLSKSTDQVKKEIKNLEKELQKRLKEEKIITPISKPEF